MSDKAGIDNIKLLSDIVKSIVDHPDDVEIGRASCRERV